MEVEKTHRSAPRPGDAHVARDDFAFPPGVDKVTDRRNLLRVDEFGVVSDVSLLLRADVTEDELPFGVDIAVLALIPERFIRHLRQQERGLDRIEAFGQVQHPVVRGDAFAAHVGEELSRAALGQNALGGLAGAAADPGHLDFGIRFLKRARFEDGFPATDVDDPIEHCR